VGLSKNSTTRIFCLVVIWFYTIVIIWVFKCITSMDGKFLLNKASGKIEGIVKTKCRRLQEV